MELEALLMHHRLIRAIGFDDAPFIKQSSEPVPVAGVICAGTRFEGMLWDTIQADGWDATDTLCNMLLRSKFFSQVHVVLLDGISVGGFNLIDLPLMADRLALPCVTVMRRLPNFTAIEYAIRKLPNPEARLEILRRAGTIHQHPPFFFQVCGAEPVVTAKVLARLTDRGHVPEALRIAHLIAAAVIKGESGKQA